MNSFTTIFFALLSLFALVGALPVNLVRDVYVPPITYPTAGVVWVPGQSYNVTWNTTDAPSQITNPNGTVVLAKNYYEDYQHPLAGNFSILDGYVTVVCPNVTAGDDYQIVLFGDSGNYSPNFTISATAA
ncbi:hypothetical protein WOLCODRAFT_136705 [Wolfiporia cocos MD-104 SS10]|uniref:Yeast cell wall synthesis Kre9/Knh1-like N-terminal domain-containing protein n=1 Tax=Wolfiporia cocos (strain MD-104) TaxID=742152 RepID=A0A2H3JTY4_WOLCO|nr:hypothetical protein WOLCODRAFT_136705 [Wolfiporia cocos MD-104 SS10]